MHRFHVVHATRRRAHSWERQHRPARHLHPLRLPHKLDILARVQSRVRQRRGKHSRPALQHAQPGRLHRHQRRELLQHKRRTQHAHCPHRHLQRVLARVTGFRKIPCVLRAGRPLELHSIPVPAGARRRGIHARHAAAEHKAAAQEEAPRLRHTGHSQHRPAHRERQRLHLGGLALDAAPGVGRFHRVQALRGRSKTQHQAGRRLARQHHAVALPAVGGGGVAGGLRAEGHTRPPGDRHRARRLLGERRPGGRHHQRDRGRVRPAGVTRAERYYGRAWGGRCSRQYAGPCVQHEPVRQPLGPKLLRCVCRGNRVRERHAGLRQQAAHIQHRRCGKDTNGETGTSCSARVAGTERHLVGAHFQWFTADQTGACAQHQPRRQPRRRVCARLVGCHDLVPERGAHRRECSLLHGHLRRARQDAQHEGRRTGAAFVLCAQRDLGFSHKRRRPRDEALERVERQTRRQTRRPKPSGRVGRGDLVAEGLSHGGRNRQHTRDKRRHRQGGDVEHQRSPSRAAGVGSLQ